jgi:hypothetical protein
MDARARTKRKDACLNAVSPITCSHAPRRIPGPIGAAMKVICLRGLYRLPLAEHNLWAGKVRKPD